MFRFLVVKFVNIDQIDCSLSILNYSYLLRACALFTSAGSIRNFVYSCGVAISNCLTVHSSLRVRQGRKKILEIATDDEK